MTAQSNSGDMYEQLIAINEVSFAGGHYEAAYHALTAALHWAHDLADVRRLQIVEQLAYEQITWIDANEPGHRLSTRSAGLRGNQSTYEALARQAGSMIRMLQLRHQ